MKKSIIFISFLLCLTVRIDCRAANTFNQTLITKVPPAVDIRTLDSKNTGEISPETGVNSGVSAQFQLRSNGSNRVYDFILQANVATQDGSNMNAYGISRSTPFIILGNTNSGNLPNSNSINNILSTPTQGQNPNAIAYPISTDITNFRRIKLVKSEKYGGYCFKIKVGKNRNGLVTQNVSTTPLQNTYYYGEDKPGIYQAVLTLSAIRKP